MKESPTSKTEDIDSGCEFDGTVAGPSSKPGQLQKQEIKTRNSKRKSNVSNESDIPSYKKVKSEICDTNIDKCDKNCDINMKCDKIRSKEQSKKESSDKTVNKKIDANDSEDDFINLVFDKNRKILTTKNLKTSIKKPDNSGAKSTAKDTISLKGPLLQLPTGSGKVYTSVSIETDEVWKGPYTDRRFNITLFFHECLSGVLGDPHTLTVKDERPYLVFPLIKGEGCSCKVTTRDFKDCISKQAVTAGQFVNREDLGLVQLHRLKPHQISILPHTIWLHFIYRFLLNIGDSGLYNAITDTKLTHIYGIDLEESRLQVKGSRPVDMMFTKLPAKALCNEVILAVKKHKDKLLNRMSELESGLEAKHIQELALKLTVEIYNNDQFKQRVKAIKNALSKC